MYYIPNFLWNYPHPENTSIFYSFIPARAIALDDILFSQGNIRIHNQYRYSMGGRGMETQLSTPHHIPLSIKFQIIVFS